MNTRYVKYKCKFTHTEHINDVDVQTFISGNWYYAIVKSITLSNGMNIDVSFRLKNEIGISVDLHSVIMNATFETNPSLLRDSKIDEILN